MVKKEYYTNGSLKETVYYTSDEFIRVVNDSGTFDTTYVKQDGVRIAELRPDSSKLFVHPEPFTQVFVNFLVFVKDFLLRIGLLLLF